MEKNESIERLPDSELSVMKIIWGSNEPIGTGKVVEILNQEKNWSRSTIQVLLARLEERGFIKCEKQNRYKYYSAIVEEEDYCSKETKTFLDHFFNNSYQKLIASLVQNQTIGEEDIEEIVQIIKEGGVKNE